MLFAFMLFSNDFYLIKSIDMFLCFEVPLMSPTTILCFLGLNSLEFGTRFLCWWCFHCLLVPAVYGFEPRGVPSALVTKLAELLIVSFWPLDDGAALLSTWLRSVIVLNIFIIWSGLLTIPLVCFFRKLFEGLLPRFEYSMSGLFKSFLIFWRFLKVWIVLLEFSTVFMLPDRLWIYVWNMISAS